MKNTFCNSLKHVLAGVCLLFSFLAPNAKAVILYWDNNGLATPTSGIWDTNTAQWSTDQNLTASPVPWDPTAAAGFPAGTAGIQFLTITVTNAVDMSGSYNGFANGIATPLISVSNLVFAGGGSLNIMPGLQAFYTAVATNNTIIRASVTGTGGIQHQGAGSIYFSTSNSFSGGLSIFARSGVNYNNNNAFGTGTITLDDPTSPTAQIILATPAVDSTATAFATVPITITNDIQTFTNSGIAIMVGLAAAPTTFTGSITMRGAAGTTNTFDVRNSTFIMSGQISGAAHLRKFGAATNVLSGNNIYTGRTIIGNGTLSVSSINNVVGGTASSSMGAPTTVADGTIALGTNATGGALLYTGTGETTDRVIDLAGTGGGGTNDQSGTGLLKFISNLTTTGIGSKTLALQGSTAGTGEISGSIIDNSTVGSTVTTISFPSGSVNITNASVDGMVVGATISGTGIAAGTTITAINTATKVVTISPAATGAGTAGQTITVPGVVNITSINKAGTGSWTLSGSNTFRGKTTISRGSLIVDSLNKVVGGTSGSSLGAPTNVANGTIALGATTTAGVLVYTGAGETTDRVINLSGTTGGGQIQNDGAGALVFTSDVTATGTGVKALTLQGTNTGDNRFSGKIVNGTAVTGVTKAQAGTWTLTASNSFTGNLTLDGGRLNIAHTNAMGGGTNFITGTASIENFTGGDLTVTNALTLSAGSMTYIGSSNNMTYTGGVIISGANRTITVSSNTLTLNSGISDAAGNRAFTKAGAGTLRLLGANTYTGNTTVNAGTLIVGAAGSFATSNNCTIAASGTLDVSAIPAFTVPGTNIFTASGSNTVEGVSAAIIKGGTTVDLGTRPITLTFRPENFTGDTAHPSLIVSQGTLSLNGNAFTVNNATTNPLGAGTYQLIRQVSGSISDSGSHTVSVTGSNLVAGGSASIVVSGGNVNMVVTVSAQPGTIASPTILGNGTVQLNFTGTPGFNYIIEAATNLNSPIVWLPLSTNTADGGGLFNFTDISVTNFTERYYRTKAE